MKGVELPINVLVIVVLALVVLIAIIALFFGVWTPGQSNVNIEATKNNACQILVDIGCTDTNIPTGEFDVGSDGNSNNDNLQGLCEEYYGITPGDVDSCKKIVCRCE